MPFLLTNRPWRRNAFGIVLTWCLVSGCVSLSGLLRENQDAGPDAAQLPPRDATTSDVGKRSDSSVDGGTRDATVSDVSRRDASDAHAHDAHDARASDSSEQDAIADVACDHLTFPFSPATACPSVEAGVEAGTCAPSVVADGSITWHPPRQQLGSCSPSALALLVTACFDPGSTNATCQAFVDSDGGAQCESCVASQSSAGSYGPVIIIPSNLAFINTGGCIALAAPCERPCATAEEDLLLCETESCSPSCLAGGSPTTAQFNAFEACTTESESCSCLTQSSATSACDSVLQGRSTTAGCYAGATFGDRIIAMGGLFCGDGRLGAGDGG